MRFVLWLLLALISSIDDIVHFRTRSTAWQLHRLITALLYIFLLQDIFTLTYIYSEVSKSG